MAETFYINFKISEYNVQNFHAPFYCTFVQVKLDHSFIPEEKGIGYDCLEIVTFINAHFPSFMPLHARVDIMVVKISG